MSIDFKSMAQILHKHLENLSEEDIQKYFPISTTPKGWVSIEDELPVMKASDIMQGYTRYKVLFKDNATGYTYVADHNSWYYDAKETGIAHWWNE